MWNRTPTAAEIAWGVSRAFPDSDEIEIGNGIKLIRMASRDKPVFKIGYKDGSEKPLLEADEGEIVTLSKHLWERIAAFVPNIEDALIPDEMKEKNHGDSDEDVLTPDNLKAEPDPDPLTPDAYRDKAEPPDLEPDPLGLSPEWARRSSS